MTEQELQEIKDRTEKATPGEWRAIEEGNTFYIQTGEAQDTTIVVVQSYGLPGNDVNDAAFIARAHQDIPVLIAEVERLRAELDTINNFAREQYANG